MSIDLHSTTDALVWAEEFHKTFPDLDIDEGAMIGWFANAMMTKADHIRRDEILDTPMIENNAGATTIREYLKILLTALWREGDGFSGKRPFGNSDWELEIYYSLAHAGFINSEIGEDGDILDYDEKAANRLIFDAIERI